MSMTPCDDDFLSLPADDDRRESILDGSEEEPTQECIPTSPSQAVGTLQPQNENDPTTPKTATKKTAQYKKNPLAPKRFKSSYICFFSANQSNVKEELGNNASVAEVSRRSAEMWKALGPEQRAHWDEVAARDKERWMAEKSVFDGPWRVKAKKSKKAWDPLAPKRTMSAFLHFSQKRRAILKEQNPTLKNTEISSLLGKLWREATEDEKRPYVEKERKEREKYKEAKANYQRERDSRPPSSSWGGISQPNTQSYSYPTAQQVSAVHHAPMGPYPVSPPYHNYNYYGTPSIGNAAPVGIWTYPVLLGPNGMPYTQFGPYVPSSTYPNVCADQQVDFTNASAVNLSSAPLEHTTLANPPLQDSNGSTP